jgi:hypothetical protein
MKREMPRNEICSGRVSLQVWDGEVKQTKTICCVILPCLKLSPSKLITINVNFEIKINVAKYFDEGMES